ncbi:MAG TPA: hypothetical protein VKU00_05110, partial [Chthonomonadaceae bacterium]|nr:hypothetical protein [Chthonomonadaceae bacterium]
MWGGVLLIVLSLLWISAVRGEAQEQAADSVEALLYTTLPSMSAHRPEMAMDADPNTYFKSVRGMDDADTFLVLLSRPVPMQSIRIVTGDNDNQDLLTEGAVETSPDT